MTVRINNSSCDLNSATGFDTVTNVPTMHATTNITIGTSNLYSAVFTAPNTTNYCNGCLIFISRVGTTGGTITVALQEYSGSVWADAGSASRAIAMADIIPLAFQNEANGYMVAGWVYFRFATPYKFTTTTAGYYRFRIVQASAAGTTYGVADSGGSNLAFIATDDRTGAIGATEDVIISGANATTSYTVTVTASQGFGSGALAATLVAIRLWGYGLMIVAGGLLTYDALGNDDITLLGSAIIHPGGELRMVDADATLKIRFRFNENGVTGNYGLMVVNGGRLTMTGAPKTSTTLYKTHWVSGTGTAASPLVVSEAVDWAVGDHICVTTTDDYNHTEYRYIITKNSSTSYVLSNTLGGAENALVYTHTANAWCLNLERNVVMDSTSATYTYYILSYGQGADYVNLDWARFENIGSGSTKRGFAFDTLYFGFHCISANYCVIYSCYCGFYEATTSYVNESWTNNIVCKATSTYAYLATGIGKTITDCFAVDCAGMAFRIVSGVNSTITRGRSIGMNTGGTASNAAFYIGAIYNVQFVDCESIACRINDLFFQSATGLTLTNFQGSIIGTVATYSMAFYGYSFNDVVLSNCNLGGGTLFSTTYPQTGQADGSALKIHAHNDGANEHYVYTPRGIIYSTGAGLPLITVHTAGGLGMCLQPTSSTLPIQWQFNVPTGNIQNKTMVMAVWCKINSSAYYGGSHTNPTLTVNYDNGTVITAVAANSTDWQLLSCSFMPITTYGQITVTISGATDQLTTNAYFYIDDMSVLYPAGYVLNLGTLDNWANALPVVPPISTSISAFDVWTALTSTMTGAGTIGKLLADNINAPIGTIDTVVDAIKVQTDKLGFTGTDVKATLDGELVDLSAGYDAAKSAAAPGDAMALTDAAIDAILDEVADGTITLRQALRVLLAEMAGKASGGGSTPIVYRDPADTKDRVSMSVDANGNRSAVVIDVS